MASLLKIATFDFTQFNTFHSAATSYVGLNYSSHATSMFLLLLMHMNGQPISKSTLPVSFYKEGPPTSFAERVMQCLLLQTWPSMCYLSSCKNQINPPILNVDIGIKA